MKLGGFAGSILSVDLNNKAMSTQPINEEIARNYIGGLGVCIKLASDLIPATGIPTTNQDLAERANRIWKKFRDLNIRDGLDDSYETFPEEWFGKNGFKDYMTGEPLTIDQAEEMKSDYYKEWEWKK